MSRRVDLRIAFVGLVLPVVLAAGFALALAGAPAAVAGDVEPAATVELTLFWGEGCPYCAAEREFLRELADTRPYLAVQEYEVFQDEENQDLFREMAAAAGIEPRSVPTTFVGERVWVGFDDATAEEIEATVDALHEGDVVPEEDTSVDVPLIGRVDVADRSLLVSTLLIGFVDGVNPCSLWVLSILLALVLHGGSRRRVVAVGTVFLVVTSAMYGLYMVGFYSVLRYAQFLPWIQRGIALVVGTMGLLQLKDALAVERGPSLGVPERAKPGMYQRMRRLAQDERSWPATLGATAVLAVGVSLLETPCTLGLPVLWTDLLARAEVPPAEAVVLFIVYLAAFLIDELVVFAVVVATMRAVKLQERHGRGLKLVSGVVMLTLAAVMLVEPALLETVEGALVVFGVAAVLATAGVLADRAFHRSEASGAG